MVHTLFLTDSQYLSPSEFTCYYGTWLLQVVRCTMSTKIYSNVNYEQ